MRVVIVGATGNLGTSLLDRLAEDPSVKEVVGVARRLPANPFRKTRFERADVARDSLEAAFADADAVIHLAWRLQPSHDRESLERTNVEGSRRVFEAAARSGARRLLYASSVGAYSPGPKDRHVDEDWPVEGIPGSTYSEQKAAVERILDEIEDLHPRLAVVRFRPGLIFKRSAASDIRRLFLGAWIPRWAFHPKVIRYVPSHPRFRFQAIHADDVAEAFQRALHREVRGPMNLASEPVIDGEVLAQMFDARPVKVSRSFLKGLASASWRLRMQPTEPGWADLAFGVPLVSSERALRLLDFRPRLSAEETLRQIIEGLYQGEGRDTPPLRPRRGVERFRPADPQRKGG